MPLLAVFVVLLTIVTMLIYVLPAARARLENFSQYHALAQAATVADTVNGEPTGDLQSSLDSVQNNGGEALVVDDEGNILARSGPGLLGSDADVLQSVIGQDRISEQEGDLRVARIPVMYGQDLTGAVVVAFREPDRPIYQLFLRSGLEAAGVATLLGGGLMLFMAVLLSRRVERLDAGARAMEQGDLSHRIRVGFEDELGELAVSLNSMAANLQNSFNQLEENDKTLNAILDELNEGVLATNLDGRVMFANPTARTMLGMESGKDGEDTEKLQKLPNPWTDFDLPGAVERCAGNQECEEGWVHSGESFLRVNLEHMPAFDNHRGGVLVVIQDLSEGRRLEINQQRFLANAAHELKTPITTILGSAELLLDGDDEDPDTRRRFLNHIHTEAERMRQLSETLLRLARVGWDQREPDLEPVELGSIVEDAADRIRPLAQSAGLWVHTEGRSTTVYADAQRLDQALLVLLSNAVTHSREAGTIRLRLEGGSVTVEDEGSGIDPDDLSHVFERSYRGRSSSGGFGLGLPICKELVESMGGKISINSQKGVGTSVKIELPQVRPEKEADA